MAIHINQISGSFSIGGMIIKGARNVVIANDSTMTINGKPASEYKGNEQGIIKIEITGNVEEVNTSMADVTINGDVNSVRTAGGDIRCKEVHGNVITMSGDVHCGNVTGSVSTMSGDIYKH